MIIGFAALMYPYEDIYEERVQKKFALIRKNLATEMDKYFGLPNRVKRIG